MEHGTPAPKAARFNYCFTYNNYTPQGEDFIRTWLDYHCKYAIFGHEIAPTTGTPHLQGYFSLKTKKRMTTLQRIFKENDVRLTLIVAKGSAQQNYKYCTKADPEEYYEVGNMELCGTGSSADKVALAEKIKSGYKLHAIAWEYPVQFIDRHSGIKALNSVADYMLSPELRDITTTVYYGTGGAGKTYRAREESIKLGLGEPYIVMNPQGKQMWFDNYVGQKCILIDDFYGWIPAHMLFRYLDCYKLQLPIKGSTTYAYWTHCFITSNKHPRDWYKLDTYNSLDKDAYYRRLPNIIYMTKDEDGNRISTVEVEDKPLFPQLQEEQQVPIAVDETIDHDFPPMDLNNPDDYNANLDPELPPKKRLKNSFTVEEEKSFSFDQSPKFSEEEDNSQKSADIN